LLILQRYLLQSWLHPDGEDDLDNVGADKTDITVIAIKR
jgi:hypothetical protein